MSGGRKGHGHGDPYCSTSLVSRDTLRGDMSQILCPIYCWRMYQLVRRRKNERRLTYRSTHVVMMKRNVGAGQPEVSLLPSATLRDHLVIPLHPEPPAHVALSGTQTFDKRRRADARGKGINVKLSYSWPLRPACTRITVTCQDRRLPRGGNGRIPARVSNGRFELRGREEGIADEIFATLIC